MVGLPSSCKWEGRARSEVPGPVHLWIPRCESRAYLPFASCLPPAFLLPVYRIRHGSIVYAVRSEVRLFPTPGAGERGYGDDVFALVACPWNEL